MGWVTNDLSDDGVIGNLAGANPGGAEVVSLEGDQTVIHPGLSIRNRAGRRAQ